MGIAAIFVLGIFSIFLAGASRSPTFGWLFFFGTLAAVYWVKTTNRKAAKRNRDAAQIKFMDLGNDTRFKWPDDAGWLGKAVGTSHYKAALDRLNCRPGSTIETTLLLVPEPNNPHDENAIAVCTEAGMMLGHISAQDNTAYIKKLRKAAGSKRIASTRARVGCFRDEKTDERMHFIRLVPNDY